MVGYRYRDGEGNRGTVKVNFRVIVNSKRLTMSSSCKSELWGLVKSNCVGASLTTLPIDDG